MIRNTKKKNPFTVKDAKPEVVISDSASQKSKRSDVSEKSFLFKADSKSQMWFQQMDLQQQQNKDLADHFDLENSIVTG